MPAIAPVAAWAAANAGLIAAGVAAAGAVASYQQQSRAADAAQEQAKNQRAAQTVRQRMADRETARQRRESIREARSARGRVLAQGATQGTSQSSGVAGAMGSVQSQAGYNISFLDQQQDLAGGASMFSQRAADARSKQAGYQAKANLFSSISSSAWSAGGSQATQNIFKQMGEGS